MLNQYCKDRDKLYAPHEPSVYCIAKVQDHNPNDYGSKVSISTTAQSNVIAGVVNYALNLYDSRTLPNVLAHVKQSRGQPVRQAVCDSGYRGPQKLGGTYIILPAPPLKRDNRYELDKEPKRCRRRAAIEPIIDHLKTDYRLNRSFLKGVAGNLVNLLMAPYYWNPAQWIRAFIELIWRQHHPGTKRKASLQASLDLPYSMAFKNAA